MKDYDELFTDVVNQKEWDLDDVNIPTETIDRIYKEIVFEEPRMAIVAHPNSSMDAVVHIMNKSTNFPYYQKLMAAFIDSGKTLNRVRWIKFKRFNEMDLKFNTELIGLMLKNDDLFTTQRLDVIFNTLTEHNNDFFGNIKAIVNHKNFKVEILEGTLMGSFKTMIQRENSTIMTIFEESGKLDKIRTKMFDITHDEFWLPQEAKDAFLF